MLQYCVNYPSVELLKNVIAVIAELGKIIIYFLLVCTVQIFLATWLYTPYRNVLRIEQKQWRYYIRFKPKEILFSVFQIQYWIRGDL